MSDMTAIQLTVAQREREMRAEQRLGAWDVVALPIFCLLFPIMAICLWACALVGRLWQAIR